MSETPDNALHSRLAHWVAGLGILVGALPARAFAADSAGLDVAFRNALEGGHTSTALGLVFLAGVGTSLTPCVYPMIAITVSVFGARQANTRREGARLSALFVLGMATLFTPLGVLAALTGGVFGAALSSPWILGGLGVLFMLFAASMFGAFELNLPASLRNRLARVGGVGPGGAFLLGLVSALVAAPCTGPVLAVLLTWVSTGGNAALGALSLFVYALGLGVLFFVVGTFAITLPKSGRWLEGVKSVFGIVMLVMAGYYLKDLLPWPLPHERSSAWLTSATLSTVAGLGLGAVQLSFHSSSLATRIRKTVGIALATVGLLATVTWMEALPAGAKISWQKDLDQARTEALGAGRPLLVDFGASWCAVCGELDRETFADPRVVAASRRFVSVHVDLSPGEVTAQRKAWLAAYGQKGLPLVVIHDAKGVERARFTRFVGPKELAASLSATR